MIKYSDAKKILSKYQGIGGKCPDEDTDLFVRQVLQYILNSGAYGNERAFYFQAENGWITLPQELETPLKIRINGAVGTVWNRWFEYKSGLDIGESCLAQKSLITQPNRYPTVYDIPSCGGYPAVMAVCDEAEDAHVIVKGTDLTGRQIITTHQGEQIVGVYLSLRKRELVKSTVKFGRITEVYKTRTNGYVNLISLDETNLVRKFLSDYTPFEETPSYQRAKIISQPCPPVCGVSIIGRIRLKDYYADDDIIPFDNLLLLSVAGQVINSMYNTEMDAAISKDKYVEKLIEREGNYKKVNNGQPLDVFRPLSGGAAMTARRAGRKLFKRFF